MVYHKKKTSCILCLLSFDNGVLMFLSCSYWGLSADYTERVINEIPNTHYNVENLTPDVTYIFSVKAVNSEGESEPVSVRIKTVPRSQQR